MARLAKQAIGVAAVIVTVLLAPQGVVADASGATPPPSITGTVTAADGAPLAGICVGAAWPGGADGNVTASDGTFALPGSDVEETAIVRFTAGSSCQQNGLSGSNYASQYYDNTDDVAAATPVVIMPGQTVTGVDAVMAVGGSITGKVTSAVDGTAVAGACVGVEAASGTWWVQVDTAADGTYDVDGLGTGSYIVEFYPSPSQCKGVATTYYATQWYEGAPTPSSSTVVAVTAGQAVGGIDAVVSAQPGSTPTSTIVHAFPSTSADGQSVTLSASVSGAGSTPGGDVIFSVGTTMLCTASLSGGSGSCSADSAPTGTDTVTGTYLGDQGFVGSAGTTSMTVSAGPAPPPPPSPGPASSGYDLVGQDGGVFVFPTGRSGGFYGSLPGLGVHVDDIAGMVSSPDDRGYFLIGRDGGVFAFGDAPFLGSLPGRHVTVHDIEGIVPTADNRGYFLVGADGGVFAFGDAPFLGSLPGEGLHVGDIIGIAATPSDQGYWLVAADGTVYAFGDAAPLGSALGTPSPVSAIASTPDGGGYWIVTQNGGVYPFGDARPFGSLPAIAVKPAHTVIGLVPTADDAGYWLIGSDGGIFAFGDAPFVGSLPGLGVHVADIVGAVPTTL